MRYRARLRSATLEFQVLSAERIYGRIQLTAGSSAETVISLSRGKEGNQSVVGVASVLDDDFLSQQASLLMKGMNGGELASGDVLLKK